MVTWYEFSLLVLFLHFLADFPLQGEFLAKWKGKDWYILFVHSFIYSFIVFLPFYFILDCTIQMFFLILITHIIIDKVKCHIVKNMTFENNSLEMRFWLYMDQLHHFVVLFSIMWVLW